VTFTPTDAVDYTTATGTVDAHGEQGHASHHLAAPTAITYGTSLSVTQLRRHSEYARDLRLHTGPSHCAWCGAQVLDMTFSPTDTVDYTSASVGIPLTVSTKPRR